MRLLLDTHIFYWWFYEPKRLSRKAFKTIKGAEEVFVSSASLWEIAIKVRLGKMKYRPAETLRSDQRKRLPGAACLVQTRAACCDAADASRRSV